MQDIIPFVLFQPGSKTMPSMHDLNPLTVFIPFFLSFGKPFGLV